MLEKLSLEDIKPSSRKYPGIIFEQLREAGDQILKVSDLSYISSDKLLFKDINFSLNKGDKVAVISKDSLATSAFFQILNKQLSPTTGTFEFGQTITTAFLPIENEHFFSNEPMSLVDWLRQFSENKDEQFIRGFLGKMLFSGEEVHKMSNVLSGGEKVRCMVSRMMMKQANLLMLDEPTNHLDLESITAFNNSLINYSGTILFTTHDLHFMQTVANRIIEITPNGILDKLKTIEEYLADPVIKEQRKAMYASAGVNV